jgi:hypothetical protein
MEFSPIARTSDQRRYTATTMSLHAHVFLQRTHGSHPEPIGQLEVEPLPPGAPLGLNDSVRFEFQGKTELGRVDQIGPADWRSDEIPIIVVVQHPGRRIQQEMKGASAPPGRLGQNCVMGADAAAL